MEYKRIFNKRNLMKLSFFFAFAIIAFMMFGGGGALWSKKPTRTPV